MLPVQKKMPIVLSVSALSPYQLKALLSTKTCLAKCPSLEKLLHVFRKPSKMPLYKQPLSLKEATKDAVVAALIKRRQTHKKANLSIASLRELILL